MITRIRIPARWTVKTEEFGGRQFEVSKHDVADFRLGEGPCGKTVISLDALLNSDYVSVCQVTDDGEIKDFYYPVGTLTGRVEITRNA